MSEKEICDTLEYLCEECRFVVTNRGISAADYAKEWMSAFADECAKPSKNKINKAIQIANDIDLRHFLTETESERVLLQAIHDMSRVLEGEE